jgi:hypothetical protein
MWRSLPFPGVAWFVFRHDVTIFVLKGYIPYTSLSRRHCWLVLWKYISRVTVSLVNVIFVSSCTHFVFSLHLDQSDHQSHLKHVVLYSDWSYSSHSIHIHTKAFRNPVSVVKRALLSSCTSFVLPQHALVTWLGSMCCIPIGSLN